MNLASDEVIVAR